MSASKLAAGLTALFGLWGAQAAVVSGFEAGLAGWQTVGDVSVQTAAIGLTPTEGGSMAFVSNMTQGQNPYSGIGNTGDVAHAFLGLPGGPVETDFLAVMPPTDTVQRDFGGALKTRFYVERAGVLSFDTDKIGWDRDYGYFTVWSEDGTFRQNDWIAEAGLLPSGVDLCERVFQQPVERYQECTRAEELYGHSLYNLESGWVRHTVSLAAPGWYWLGIGMGTVLDRLAPSVLAVDNVRLDVAEPATPALLLAALALLAVRQVKRVKRATPACS